MATYFNILRLQDAQEDEKVRLGFDLVFVFISVDLTAAAASCSLFLYIFFISFTSFGPLKYKPQDEFGHLKLRQCLMARWMAALLVGWPACLPASMDVCSVAYNCCHCQRVGQLLLLGFVWSSSAGRLPSAGQNSSTANSRSFVFDPFNGPVNAILGT